MQAFGASPTSAPFGVYGADTSETASDADIIAHFSGYIESAVSSDNATATAAFAGLSKNQMATAHTVPVDAAYAVDPTAAITKVPIAISALAGTDNALQIAAAGENQLTPEVSVAYSLVAKYHSTALSSADLQALQSTLPVPYASLSGTQPAAGLIDVSGIANPQQNPDVLGQFLPASDLKALFGETPIAQSAEALATNPSTKPVENIVPQANVAPTSQASITANTPPSALITEGTPIPVELAGLEGNKSPAFENGTEISRANGFTAKLQMHTAQQNAQQNANGEADLDADGQVLAVTQKAQKTQTSNSAQAAGAKSIRSAKSTTSGLNETTAATGVSTASANISKSTEKTTNSPSGEAAKARAPEALASTPTNIVHSVPRGGFDWSSPWITPEKATGWPEGFATSLVSGGLGGLMGNQSSLTGMGMLGGQPNPTLGGHVTKQLNLNMTRAVKAGEQEFSMRMDPPELGRVSVKLKFGQNGLVKSQVMAERPETLEMLQREIRGLERAIEAGGHKSEQGGISFSLDTGGQESAGKAFAEALQQDRLREEITGRLGEQSDEDFLSSDNDEVAVNLDEILANVTPETGIDVRV